MGYEWEWNTGHGSQTDIHTDVNRCLNEQESTDADSHQRDERLVHKLTDHPAAPDEQCIQ